MCACVISWHLCVLLLESDYSEDSYSNSHLPPIIKKQPCRSASLLVHLRDKETDNLAEPPVKRTKLDHSLEELGQASNNQTTSMSSSPNADASSVADHQDSSHTSSFNSAHLPTDGDIPLDTSRFAKIPASDDFVCARTNIIYISSKPKTNAEVNFTIDWLYCSSTKHFNFCFKFVLLTPFNCRFLLWVSNFTAVIASLSYVHVLVLTHNPLVMIPWIPLVQFRHFVTVHVWSLFPSSNKEYNWGTNFVNSKTTSSKK